MGLRTMRHCPQNEGVQLLSVFIDGTTGPLIGAADGECLALAVQHLQDPAGAADDLRCSAGRQEQQAIDVLAELVQLRWIAAP